MANKLAPYKDNFILGTIRSWWDIRTEDGRTLFSYTTMELYRDFLECMKINPWDDAFVDRDQFAKCLVALKIGNVGSHWEHLPSWEPKVHELTRAKATDDERAE